MADSNFIKCRFCNWKTVKWYRNDMGVRMNPNRAFAKLERHMNMEHSDQADAIFEAGEAFEEDINDQIKKSNN